MTAPEAAHGIALLQLPASVIICAVEFLCKRNTNNLA